MTEKEKDDYYLYFRGAKVSKYEAKKISLGIFTGSIGILITLLLFGKNKIAAYTIIAACSLLGYFFLGNKLVKRR